MTTSVAVILSGCGVFDGSEIHEAVLTLLCLEQANIQYQCLAPNINQTQVTNHLTQQKTDETRNILVEAARIARGDIKDMTSININDFGAAIYPGGFGAALNLSNFATEGANCSIQTDVLNFATSMAQAKKPQGFICISPCLISKIYGPNVELTIGNDIATAKQIEAMGGKHTNCSVNDIIIDTQHKVISTPAYMLAGNISSAYIGIHKLVHAIITMLKPQ